MSKNIQSCDSGPAPAATNIANAAKSNKNYRTTIWTGTHLQATLMCIQPKDDIGLEVHPDTDQFLRIECGKGMALMGADKSRLTFRCPVYAGSAVFVPAGTWHNIINMGNCPLKLYSIYAPPHHPHGTVHKTKEDAEKSEQK